LRVPTSLSTRSTTTEPSRVIGYKRLFLSFLVAVAGRRRGEGGRGGALALAVADEVWILENSVYSVLSPEGFASILWKDSKRASEAAEVMKLTADDLKCLGIVEQVIREPKSYTSQTMAGVCEELKNMLSVFLKKYGSMDERQLLNHRYDRFRKM